MIIIGANLPFTSYGLKLGDGGVAMIRNGELSFAISEERLSRQKKDGGFAKSLAFLLKREKFTLSDVDDFVVSSCCDITGIPNNILDISDCILSRCGHHDSHALGSFSWSEFSSALVLVVDSGGDIINLDDGQSPEEWWKHYREQHTVYFVEGNKYSVIDRHAVSPYSVGFGEFYRAITYFLGWRGARYAGNSMALAALSSGASLTRSKLNNISFFNEINGDYKFPTGNNPNDPISMVKKFFQDNGIVDYIEREKSSPFENYHFDIAAWLQSELDRYLLSIFDKYSRIVNTNNFIISGGVAYNCVSIGRFQKARPQANVFVQPASGDVGQCVGNAVYGYLQQTGRILNIGRKSVNLGGDYRVSSKRSAAEFDKNGIIQENDARMSKVTEAISAGEIAIIFHNRSEYGPRALGFRSIIALAEEKISRRLLNREKMRNYLMPSAPVVLYEDRNVYFDCEKELPYMTEVVPVRTEYAESLKSCTQGSGWCRIQTVSRYHNEKLWMILKLLKENGNIPVVLNTSLNGPGQPMIENVAELFDFFYSSRIKYAWVNGFLYRKTKKSEKTDLGLEKSSYSERISETIYNPEEIAGRLSFLFPDLYPSVRNRFLLKKEYIEWVLSGRKTTTIRYKLSSVEYPSEQILDLYASERFESFDQNSTPYFGKALIHSIEYKCFGDLDDVDATNDGFSSKDELLTVLKEIYPTVKESDVVTIFKISIIS